MKKFFTLIAMALMAIGANAQTEWNFSSDSWTAEKISATKTVDGLTVYATSDAVVEIGSSNKTVDGVSYTQCLKFGGSGKFSSGTPTTRVLAFEVTGACDIAIAAVSAKSSATDRYLVVKTSDGTKLSDDSICVGATPTTYTYSYTGTDAATIYVYSGNSGINLYDIKVTYSSDPTAIKSTPSIEEEETPQRSPKKPSYNISGQRVSKNAKGLVIKNGKKYFNK